MKMDTGINGAKNYISAMTNASHRHLREDAMYGGKEGHKRFAVACGVALNDFNEAGQKELIGASYGALYVKACNLKPLLSAKEWHDGLLKGKAKQYNA